jgi:nuclear transport factor 2 (NTF2) superfamily protein
MNASPRLLVADPNQTVPACMTISEIEAMLAGIVEAFHAQDVERLAQDWTEDIVIRFAGAPEIRGKQAAKEWLASRFKRQKDYRLVKTFQAVTGNIIGDSWTGEWTDALTGCKMQGKGMEFLTMAGNRIATWDAVFNVWEAGTQSTPPVT